MTGTRRSLPRASIISIKSAIQKVARFRWLVFIIGCLAHFSISMIITSLSLTVVAMISHDDEDGHSYGNLSTTAAIVNSTTATVMHGSSNEITVTPISSWYSSLWFSPPPLSDRTFYVNWTNTDKDRMLQASFWGTLAISAFGGRLCEFFGPRRTVSLALITAGVSNCLYPTIARESFIGAYMIRVAQGMVSGILHPSLFVMISRWSTSDERTLSSALVVSGGSLGNLISLPLTGLLVSGSFLGGWPSVFYLFGILCLIIAILWYIMIYDTPEQHPHLSPEELEEILTKRSLKSGQTVPVPWCELATSLPVYAYLVQAFTYGWVIAVVASQIPSFYEEILGFSHEANGFGASLPWLVSMMTSLIGGSVADKVRRSGRFSLGLIRKVFTIIGLGIVSIGLVAITTLGDHRIAVVLTLGISKGMGTLNVAGSGSSHLDIAPTFAGTLTGFSGVLSSIASLSANEGVARIVGNNPTAENWYRFFYISAAINAFGIIVFCLFGSGDTQSWDPSSIRRQSVKSNISIKSRKSSEIKSETLSPRSHHQSLSQQQSEGHNNHQPQDKPNNTNLNSNLNANLAMTVVTVEQLKE